MIAGKMYNPSDPELIKDRYEARLLMHTINTLRVDSKEKRDESFRALVKNAGENLNIEPPFYYDYGYNIETGSNVYMNFNCCILDVSTVTIGNNAMFGPNVQIYTATHPIGYKERNSGKEFAKSITIGL
jgi:maltose O-acetyltransferase